MTTHEITFMPDDELEIRQIGPCDAAPQPPASALPISASDWGIDNSVGRKILVYKNCSVIEDEQAELVLRLLGAPPDTGNVGADPLENSATRKAAYTAVAQLREGQMAMHGGEFDQYRMAMCTAASILEAMLSVPAPGGLLDEMRSFINLMKGAALQGKEFFTAERLKQVFEECVRLNGRYLELETGAALPPGRGMVPMTEERAREVIQEAGLMFTAPDMQVVRATEKAHGIGVTE